MRSWCARLMGLSLLVACTPDEPEDTDPAATTPVDTAPTGVVDTSPPEDTAPIDTAPPEPTGPDCSALPPVPAPYNTINGFSTAEDFDFDGEGYAVSIYDGNLVGKDLYGNTKIITPNVSAWTAGTRVLPTGDWVINDAQNGVVQLVDATTGGRSLILGGLSYPNGLEVDENNQVYVAEQSAGRIQQVDAYTLDSHVVATGLNNPNGVILSPDGSTLYAGSFGGGMVYAIDRVAPGVWDPPRKILQTNGQDGGFDGINVDACGNVYITEYIAGDVWRITPDGKNTSRVASLPSGWIPNMRWGSTFGGWDPNILYVSDRDQGRIFALDIGIEGKKHVLAP